MYIVIALKKYKLNIINTKIKKMLFSFNIFTRALSKYDEFN